MKTIIFYFSGTGNNLAVARQLAKELGDTDILPMRYLMTHKEISSEYDWVGFSAPTYYSHIPPYVEECMKNITYTGHQKVFLIAGCGGNRGLTMEDLRKLVNDCNKEVALEYMVIYPGNYITSYDAFPNWYQKFFIQQSYKKLHKIANDIKNDKSRKPLGKSILYLYDMKHDADSQKIIASFASIGQQYTISDECTGCGACAKLCPVGNITMENGHPVFGDHCNQCMACIQWCDRHALDDREKAKNRTRYHHSDIQRQDLFSWKAMLRS